MIDFAWPAVVAIGLAGQIVLQPGHPLFRILGAMMGDIEANSQV